MAQSACGQQNSSKQILDKLFNAFFQTTMHQNVKSKVSSASRLDLDHRAAIYSIVVIVELLISK
jgi:hypothetical protein